MSNIKSAALYELNELYTRGDISYLSYSMIFDGLDDIETLHDRDAEIKELWEEFGDVSMNPETECMEEAFLAFRLVRTVKKFGIGLTSDTAKEFIPCCTVI